jgi:preprotein translocase subunit Sec61beta
MNMTFHDLVEKAQTTIKPRMVILVLMAVIGLMFIINRPH